MIAADPVSDAIPCPYCGSEQLVADGVCRVCGSNVGPAGASNAGTGRCARCGSEMPQGFDFCPVCGLDQRLRFPRPPTHAFRLQPAQASGPAMAPASAPQPAPAAHGAPGAPLGYAPQPISAPYPAPPGSQDAGVSAFAPVAKADSMPQPAASLGGFVPVGRAAVAARGSGAASASIVVVRHDGTEGEHFPITGSSISIGRTQGDVRFGHDGFLSPLHARVELEGGVFWLVDTGSRNGAYVRLRRAEAVYPGDLFLVGHQLLRLENLGDDEHERADDADGTRPFGSPIEHAWAKVQLIGGGGASGDTYFLRGTQVLFGRESGEIIFPHDAYLSRTHARLRMEVSGGSMSVYLEDLDSANGTYLRIRGRAELRTGDMFRLGDQILRLRVG